MENDIRQKEYEGVLSYLRREETYYLQMKGHRIGKDEKSFCKHVARRLNSNFKTVHDVLISNPNLSRTSLEKVLRQADHDLRHSGGEGDGGKATGHALYTAGKGRSNGGFIDGTGHDDVFFAAGKGRGERATPVEGRGAEKGRDRGGSLYCMIHGPISTHRTKDCEYLAEEFEAYIEYWTRHGPCHRTLREREGPRGVDRPGGAHSENWRQSGGQGRGGRLSPPRHVHVRAFSGLGWNDRTSPPRPGHGRGGGLRGNRHDQPSGGRRFGGGFSSSPSSGGDGTGRSGDYPPNDAARRGGAVGPPRNVFHVHSAEGYFPGESSEGSLNYPAWTHPAHGSDYSVRRERYFAEGDGGYSSAYPSEQGEFGGEFRTDTGGGFSDDHYSREQVNGPDESSQGLSAAGPDTSRSSFYPAIHRASPPDQDQGRPPASAATSTTAPPASPSSGAPSTHRPLHLLMAQNVPRGEFLLGSDSVFDSVSGSVSDSAGNIRFVDGIRAHESVRVGEPISASAVEAALVCETASITPAPAGSEKWASDSGATTSVNNDISMLYVLRKPEPWRDFIPLDNTMLVRVEAIGGVDLRFHQRDVNGHSYDFDAQFQQVLFSPKIGFNLFSTWKASQEQVVSHGPDWTTPNAGASPFWAWASERLPPCSSSR